MGRRLNNNHELTDENDEGQQQRRTRLGSDGFWVELREGMGWMGLEGMEGYLRRDAAWNATFGGFGRLQWTNDSHEKQQRSTTPSITLFLRQSIGGRDEVEEWILWI